GGGGETRRGGRRPPRAPWQVGVAWPEAGTAEIARVLALRDTALATSGDYRQYFEFEGRRYSHEIDPATGRPIAHALASVTVLDAACMRADALATGLLVLGPARGPALAHRLGISALFLIHRDSGFEAITTGTFPPAQ
ncbi:MAG TPA: FAD:protein FMN transferase, partial [Gammaproteobacteria bacterium]|nr:FAD:protein FMN transferase [Gammaproteobacteria bacterium]